MQHRKNRIRKKRVVCIKYTTMEEMRREKRRVRLVSLCYCILFSSDSKGEDRSDGGHSAIVSGMCFVHVFLRI